MTQIRTRPRRVTLLAVALLSLAIGPVLAQEPSASPVAAGPGSLGASQEVYRESFTAAPAWVDLGEDESGRTAVEDGTLQMSSVGEGTSYRDAYVLPEAVEVIRVEALIDLDAKPGTGAGVACGSALGVPRWLVAGVNNADEWWLGRLIDGRLQVVERGQVMLPASPSAAPVRVSIECAVAREEGGDYALTSIDGRAVGVARLDIPVGPYDKAGLFVGTDGKVGSATYDDLVVHVGDAYERPQVEPEPDRPSE